MQQRIIIVGGHGKVSLHATKLLSSRYQVISIIRDAAQTADIEAAGAQAKVLSIEDSTSADFAQVFKDVKAVIWSAGAGGKGGRERTKAVDEVGAIKVIDAIASLQNKPKYICVSAIDVRDRSKVPSHYDDEDVKLAEKGYAAIGPYYDAKLAADKYLAKQSFNWTILRPGQLLDEAGTGKVELGITKLAPSTAVPREDVARVIAELVERDDAGGMALDLRKGDTPVADAVEQAIKTKASKLNF